MADRKLTILELHFNDSQFGPKWIGAGSEEDAEEAEREATEELDVDVEGGRGFPASPKTLVGAVAAIGLVGGLAVAAKALASKRGSDQTTLDDEAFGEEPEFESAEFEE